jgi:hypothetical protein
MNPKYPVYIISKGRWKTRLTSKALERMNVPYSIVVEPQEYENYAAEIDPNKILVLPFSNLGQGSIPARNWVWDHAISIGARKHWILDDNIENFHRLNKNMKPIALTGAVFKAAEDFVARYSNVPLAGFNYYSFCKATDKVPPYVLNTRIYSTILIQNDIPYRWRGKYNEDTDLSLRVLKDGYCTIQFNAFLAGKVTTQRMKGGNTDDVYKEGTLEKSQALVDFHPDVSKVVWKFNRWHHHVDYSIFKKNRLKKIVNTSNMPKINNYGMVLTNAPILSTAQS